MNRVQGQLLRQQRSEDWRGPEAGAGVGDNQGCVCVCVCIPWEGDEDNGLGWTQMMLGDRVMG